MNFFDPLLGFAVLTGPLWLILILLPVSIWIAVKVARRFKQRHAKIIAGIGIFLVVFFLPFADEIVGRMYLGYLCATEAGVKVYQTVELPKEYWDEGGSPRFYDQKNGNFNLKGYRSEYVSGTYSGFFHIDNAGFKRVDVQTGVVIGEVTDFMHWGGWVRRNLSPHNNAFGCTKGKEYSDKLIYQVFRRKLP